MSYKKVFTGALAAASLLLSGGAVAQTTWKMALGDAAGGTQWELGTKFAELINEKTGGQIKVDLFPNGQLGSEQDTVNNASMGILDLSVLAINNVTPFSPSVGALTLPYMIQGVEDAKTLSQGPIGQQMIENTIRDAGVRIIAWTYSGCRVLTNSKRPVETVEDLQGLVIRVPKNEIMIAAYQSWGVNPTPMAWSETFTALQQGVVDGQDTPYITIHAMKFYEIQKYLTDICYVFLLEPLIISEGVFQAQSPEIQEAILAAGKEATDHSYQYLIDSEERIKADLTAKGMEIVEPANDEKEWIELATQAVWPNFYDSVGGVEEVNRILEALGRPPVSN